MLRVFHARGRHRHSERGGAAVEFAIVLPLFCAVLFGIIDYGWYFYQRMAISAAVRDGLRTGVTISQSATTPNDCASIAIARAKADLTGSALDPTSVTFATSNSSAYPTRAMTLSATYTPKALISFIPFPASAATFSMTMMYEVQVAP
ncbi:MAG TPA: TadE/TadG family type IV pilus assembly protein [Polyangia bacterium]|nr:TadE/TadG family type IV pilus assembly protein [Polyangia bacterium]